MDDRDAERALSNRDQSSADADQTSSDLDQSLSDLDQVSSDRDQRAADRDQRLADRDREPGRGGISDGDAERDRHQSAEDRDRSTDARQEATRLRHDNATRRDRAAADRDAAATARDRLSASIDAELQLLATQRRTHSAAARNGHLDVAARLTEHLKRAADARARAAAQRAAAASDRDRSAHDRELAAEDREAAARELERESTDHLTGAMGRRAGLTALRRELDRAARGDEPLVFAFVDVNGLKGINDAEGHLAGDETLRRVARSLMSGLRSYDVVMRFGGDEFVCSIAGQDLAGARERFARITADLTAESGAPAISVGLACRRPDESVDALIARADGALLATRRAAQPPPADLDPA